MINRMKIFPFKLINLLKGNYTCDTIGKKFQLSHEKIRFTVLIGQNLHENNQNYDTVKCHTIHDTNSYELYTFIIFVIILLFIND